MKENLKKIFLFGFFPSVPFILLVFHNYYTQFNPEYFMNMIFGFIQFYITGFLVFIIIGYGSYSLLARRMSTSSLLKTYIILFIFSQSVLGLGRLMILFQGGNSGLILLFLPVLVLYYILIFISLMSIGAIPFTVIKFPNKRLVKYIFYFSAGILCSGLFTIVLFGFQLFK